MPTRTRTNALALLAALTLAATSTTAHAAPDDDETPPDARLEGYAKEGGGKGPLVLPSSGSATTWFLAIILGGLCLGVMSKNGKRSHMD